MATIPCYPGDPTNEERRMAIWKWAKDNLIDKGMPFEKVGKEINDYFFAGQARPELIADILGGRKTPLRELSTELWRKQYNRRQIVQQAQNLSRFYGMNPVLRALQTAWEIPRFIGTLGHGHVFPLTHAGDLLFRPESWGTFAKGYRDVWGALRPDYAARLVASMENDPWYDLALHGKLDVTPNSRPDDIISKYLLTSRNPAMRGFLEQVKKWGVEPAERAWDALKVMRFNLWKKQMQKYATPDMSGKQLQELSTQLADWANHATGSGKLRMPGKQEAIPGAGLLYGPKLTASKLARFTMDPLKTLNTVRKMASGQETTAGERAAAMTRVSGAVQYVATRVGFLAANWGINQMLGVPAQKNVNLTNPTQSDWLKFKAAGMDVDVPGLDSETRLLGKIIATQMLNDEDFKKRFSFFGATKLGVESGFLETYGRGKLGPSAQIAADVATGKTLPLYRPAPWSGAKGTAKSPPMGWAEYALSKGPIPTTGPIAFAYDKFRQQGASALEASNLIRGLGLFGLDFLGLHTQEERESPPPPPPRAHSRSRR